MSSDSPAPTLLDRLLNLLDRLAIAFRLLILIVLMLATLGLATLGIWKVVSLNRVHHLVFAVGDPTGESYILGQAIAHVVETYHPNIQIELLPTQGSTENLQKLKAGNAQLATAQADIPVDGVAKAVAVLYHDVFQLVVKDQLGIEQFTDLRGKRVGVEPEGGQFYSFLEVAQHYGLTAADFLFVGADDQTLNEAFKGDRIDAVFHVRAPGNQLVSDLVQHAHGQLLPLEQAEAMKIKQPAFESALIPKGAYKGNLPAVPPVDIPSVAVEKVLLASKRVDDTVIREITAILDEHRQEIANSIPDTFAEVRPLVASISRPSTTEGIRLPLHPGAQSFYDRNKPSFIQKNSDYIALGITIGLTLGSWVWELKSLAEQRRKGLADRYVDRVIQLMDTAAQNRAQMIPERRQAELYTVFDEAAQSLRRQEISQESFRTFNEAYKTAREKIERDIEVREQRSLETQQARTADYINDLLLLLQNRANYSQEALQADLARIFKTTLDDLVKGNISQESFRTFIEVYNTVKATCDRST